jgi:hypothetical protein
MVPRRDTETSPGEFSDDLSGHETAWVRRKGRGRAGAATPLDDHGLAVASEAMPSAKAM